LAKFDVGSCRAVVFDYGSTLIRFGEEQIRRCDRALADALEDMYGPVDFERLRAIRNEDRRAPYSGDYVENDMAEISARAIRELYGVEPTAAELDRVLKVRFDVFVDVIEIEDYVPPFLEELRRDCRLGLLSNYPDGDAVRASLSKVGIHDCFDAVVVSGDVGRVKPHELPFKTVLDKLDVAPCEALYVGDNWLGDIQGAKRVGMGAAWIVQWNSPEQFDRQPGDHEPDVTIERLTDLPGCLGRDAARGLAAKPDRGRNA